MKLRTILIITSSLLLSIHLSTAAQLANGIKIGEITQHTATVWTRITEHKQALHQDHKFGFRPGKDHKLKDLPNETPGSTGEVSLKYWIDGSEEVQKMDWTAVDQEKDFTRKLNLTNLQAGKKYQVRVSVRPVGSQEITASLNGTFVTAPVEESAAPLSFSIITGQGFYRRKNKDGHQIYQSMLEQKPAFLIHTGDVIYYDKSLPYAKNPKLARYKWNRIYALPKLINFHKQVSCYYLKDDHDVLKNDAWPGQKYGDLSFDQGVKIFREQTPFPEQSPYRTVRWGKHTQLWFMEGREFRSPNKGIPESQRTIWGKKQISWLEKSLSQSDATFKFIISPTPIVGPDRTTGKQDNHANAYYQREGDTIRKMLSQHKNTIVICGDRHWQYSSFDQKTGLMEFCSGPVSDLHASGYNLKSRKPNHKYLKICGGYLNVQVKENPITNTIDAHFTYHDVNGKINSVETVKANDAK